MLNKITQMFYTVLGFETKDIFIAKKTHKGTELSFKLWKAYNLSATTYNVKISSCSKPKVMFLRT